PSSNLPATGQENAALAAITGIATFTDPAGVGVETSAGDFTATINWGDTTTDTGTVVSDGSGNYHVDAPAHTYVEEGTYTVNVTLKHDLLGPVTTPAQTIIITDPSVVLNTTALSFSAVEGITSASQPVATFTDPGGAELVGEYAATIDWGDSTSGPGTITFSGGTFTVSGSHTYTEESAAGNPYQIQVTVTHGTAPATGPSVTATATI